jgi:phage terminase large subunit-like protein
VIPGYDPHATAAGYEYRPELAERAIGFVQDLCSHVEGEKAGKPFTLEPWQRAVFAALFGWVKAGVRPYTRRYREAFIYVPRKNGKTPMCAALCLYMLFCDGEAGAQIFGAAADTDQAALLYRHARGMVEQNPALSRRAKVFRAFKSITRVDDAASAYRVLSADAHTKHGGNPHLVIVDELHAQPDRELVDVLQTSMASQNRRQPLLVHITTADYLRESICNEKYDYACKVRDGVVNDPSFLPVIYEATADEDWTREETWRKANPNLGVSVSLDYLQRECKRAQETPSYENTFKRLHLNLRTEQDVRWLPMQLWDRGAGDVPVEELAGRDCYAAIDFGWRDDFAALALVFPPEDSAGVWNVLPWFWLPEEGQRDKRRPPTADFLAAGLVTLTPGNSTDIEAIYATLEDCRAKYSVREVALDPANARKQGQDLMADGYQVFEFIQSKRSYNEPCRFLESLLKEGRLRHGGHRVLRWMAANAAAELDGLGQMMPKKKKSAEKIDGICALTMALGRAMLRPAESSWYSYGALRD